jgi:hypothetical protein
VYSFRFSLRLSVFTYNQGLCSSRKMNKSCSSRSDSRLRFNTTNPHNRSGPSSLKKCPTSLQFHRRPISGLSSDCVGSFCPKALWEWSRIGNRQIKSKHRSEPTSARSYEDDLWSDRSLEKGGPAKSEGQSLKSGRVGSNLGHFSRSDGDRGLRSRCELSRAKTLASFDEVDGTIGAG